MDQLQINTWWLNVQQENDKKSFERIYLATWRILYAQAWSRLGDEDIAKDMVQDIFIKVWDSRKKISLQGSLVAYLKIMLKNRIIDYFQSEHVRQSILEQAFLLMEYVDDNSESSLSYEQTEIILKEELEKMPQSMREIFLLRLENKNIKTIAESLNLADQTVSNLLSEARKRLRQSLPKRFENYQNLQVITFLYILNELLTNN